VDLLSVPVADNDPAAVDADVVTVDGFRCWGVTRDALHARGADGSGVAAHG